MPCRYDLPDPRAALVQLLRAGSVPFSQEPDGLRFALCEGGCRWEVLCRFGAQTVLFYGVYPFVPQSPLRMLGPMNEINAQLRQGSLFLSEGRLILRVDAAVLDAYLAHETLMQALEYHASAMRYFWERLRRCAGE